MMDLDNIYCIDCFKGFKALNEGSVDLIITDPPYEVNYMAKQQQMREFDHGTLKHNVESVDCGQCIDFGELANQFFRILKNNSHCYIWCSEKQMIKIVPLFEAAGFRFMQQLIWVKNRGTLDATFGGKYCYCHEIILFFSKGWKKLNMRNGRKTVFIHNIYGSEQGSYIHPTQKPISILSKLVINSSLKGDVVFDPFSGSGNHLIAAKRLGRKFIGFELSKQYYDVIVARLLLEEQQRHLSCF